MDFDPLLLPADQPDLLGEKIHQEREKKAALDFVGKICDFSFFL